jgi:hypothetical protein
MKEKKTEEMTEELAAADKRLHDVQSQMKIPNKIRAMIENGETTDDVYEYVMQMIKMGLNIKEDALKEIRQCHLDLAERHMMLTDNWQFVNIGEKSK